MAFKIQGKVSFLLSSIRNTILHPSLRDIFVLFTALYPLALLLLSLVHLIFPQRNGWLAITQVFAPYLFLPLLILLPLALLRSTMLLRIVLALCIILFCFCYFPRISFGSPAPASGQQTTVLTWNMMVGRSHDAALLQLLKEKRPAIVALQEVDRRDAFASSPEFLRLYPYQLARPAANVPSDLALLSTYPILEHGIPSMNDSTWNQPQILWARLDLGSGRSLIVVTAHPVVAINSVPNCYFCSDHRDAQLRFINAFVSSLVRRGESVLLVGDMNVTDREQGYRELRAGLQDTFARVGVGSGHSWGIRRFNPLWPLLRIDYMLAGPGITPLAINVDCTARGSDHCVLTGHFDLSYDK